MELLRLKAGLAFSLNILYLTGTSKVLPKSNYKEQMKTLAFTEFDKGFQPAVHVLKAQLFEWH